MASFDPRAVVGGRPPGRTPVWVIATVAGCSVVALVAFAASLASGAVPAGVSLVLALLPIPLVLAGVLYLDRLEPEPPGRLMFVFLWGAAAAGLIGLAGTVTGTQLITMPPLRPGGFAAATAAATLAAPVVEETLKGAVLVGLLWLRRDELDGTHDGVVYASMAGLGFALVDNIYYFAQATHHGVGSVAATFVLRGVAAPVCQSLFTSMIGVGVAFVAMSRAPGGRWWAVAAGWIAAVGLHALWNESLAAGVGRLAATYAILAGVIAVLLVAVAVDRRRIVALIVRYLPDHAPAGVVTPLDVAMLSRMRDRHQARQWARLHGGLAAQRALADYQLAATELALLHRRAERQVIDTRTFTERRDGLLTVMRNATSDLLARMTDPPRPPWAASGPSCFASAATRPGRPPTEQEPQPG